MSEQIIQLVESNKVIFQWGEKKEGKNVAGRMSKCLGTVCWRNSKSRSAFPLGV